MTLEKNLKAVGLSTLEIQLYCTLLQKRLLLLSELAKFSGISRSNCVYGVQKLQERGLVVFCVRGKRKYVDIVDPVHAFAGLQDLESQHYAKKEKIFIDLQGIIPARLLHSSNSIQTLSGAAGLRHVLVDLITQKQDIYWIGTLSTIFKALTEEEIKSLVTLPRMKGSTTIYHLTDATSLQYPKFLERIGKLRDVRVIEQDLPDDCIIGWTHTKLAVITIKQKTDVAVTVIEDQTTIKLLSTLFSIIWQTAQPI